MNEPERNFMTVDEQMAARLSNPRLAQDLESIASNIRTFSPDKRAGRLREAARRLTPSILITLSDGRQVALMHGSVQVRSSMSGTWSLPISYSPTPHEPDSWYLGEW